MVEGLRLYKRDWTKVTRFVGTRSAAQVRSHAQKYFDKVVRDKTDDYVPRARPKRKSSTPYPRKVRDDPSVNLQHHQLPASISQSSQIPPPVQSTHHPTPSHPVHQSSIAPSHAHHQSVQVQLAAAQSPLLSHLPSSPYLSHPAHHAMPMQPSVPPHLYSPFMSICPGPSPDLRNPHFQSTAPPQPSPVSFMSGHAYTSPSPVLAPHGLPIPPQSMYGMYSPITPTPYPASLGHSPSLGRAPVSVVVPSKAQHHSHPHVPLHSHPGGPMENCAKCAALQRYGNVFQELGDLSSAKSVGTSLVTPNSSLQSSQRVSTSEGTQSPEKKRVIKNSSNSTAANMLLRQQTPPPGSNLPHIYSGLSPAPGIVNLAPSLPAVHRAHRCKVMKAKRARQKNREVVTSSPSDEESLSPSALLPHDKSTSDSSSIASSTGTQDQACAGKEAAVSDIKMAEKGAWGDSEMKRMRDCTSDFTSDEAPVKKKTRGCSLEGSPSRQAKATDKCNSSLKKVSTKGQCSTAENAEKGAQRRGVFSGTKKEENNKSSGSQSSSLSPRSDSPGVDTYTPSEQKEIFDAVHSLQILAKPVGSSESGRTSDCEKSVKE